jgi:hypothetical protein
MSNRLKKRHPLRARCWCLLLMALIVALLSFRNIHGQTSSTGALTGETLDPSGGVLPGYPSEQRICCAASFGVELER